MESLQRIDRSRRARNTRVVALATVAGSIVALPVGLAWGFAPAVASAFVALAALAAVVAWLAPGMEGDALPWVLLSAGVATALATAIPDGRLRAADLVILATIAAAGALLPAVQVLAFTALAVAAEVALLLAMGGEAQAPSSPLLLGGAVVAISAIVGTAAALRARGTWRALGQWVGSEERARDAQSRSEENATAFRLLASSTSDLFLLVGADGRVTYASPSVERLLGVGLAAVRGHLLEERVLEEDQPQVRALRERALAGEPARGTIRVALPGGALRFFDAALDPWTGETGPLVAVAARDVTEQRLLAEQLHQAQRLEAVGQLARGVAHDFNNLLAVVQSGAGLAREALPAGHPAHADLADVTAAADRGAALARQLLAFTRPEGQGPQRTEVGMVLGQMARFLPRLMGHSVRVKVSEHLDVGEVPLSPTQLEQVILNLAINARDAMPDGGWIRIEARRRRGRGGGPGALASAERVEIAVHDEGAGIPEAVRRRLFEPFFTTKEPGRGSGLGLASSLGIVERAGGAIRVESRPGKGSTFLVVLPALPPAGITAPDPAAALPERRRSRVLIVDHDPALVALLSRLLAARDHEVAAAATVLEARQQAASYPGAVDVLVTSLDLGGEHGVAVMGEVRRTSPQARAVLVTGEVRDPGDVEHLLSAGVELVRRPVTAEALAEVVERAAARAPAQRAPALA